MQRTKNYFAPLSQVHKRKRGKCTPNVKQFFRFAEVHSLKEEERADQFRKLGSWNIRKHNSF